MLSFYFIGHPESCFTLVSFFIFFLIIRFLCAGILERRFLIFIGLKTQGVLIADWLESKMVDYISGLQYFHTDMY